MAIMTRNVGVDVKKHRTMFSKSERKFLAKKLSKLNVSRVGGHCKNRELARGIGYTKADFQDEINIGNLIEIQKYNDGSVRYLFRGSRIVESANKVSANVIFVVMAKDGEVRSCWLNNVNDYHDTLDMSVYDENAEIWEWV